MTELESAAPINGYDVFDDGVGERGEWVAWRKRGDAEGGKRTVWKEDKPREQPFGQVRLI